MPLKLLRKSILTSPKTPAPDSGPNIGADPSATALVHHVFVITVERTAEHLLPAGCDIAFRAS